MRAFTTPRARLLFSLIATTSLALAGSRLDAAGGKAQAAARHAASKPPLVAFSYVNPQTGAVQVLKAVNLPARGDGIDFTWAGKESCIGGFQSPPILGLATENGLVRSQNVNGRTVPLKPYLLNCGASSAGRGQARKATGGFNDLTVFPKGSCPTTNGVLYQPCYNKLYPWVRPTGAITYESHVFLAGTNTIAKARVVRPGARSATGKFIPVPAYANELDVFPNGIYKQFVFPAGACSTCTPPNVNGALLFSHAPKPSTLANPLLFDQTPPNAPVNLTWKPAGCANSPYESPPVVILPVTARNRLLAPPVVDTCVNGTGAGGPPSGPGILVSCCANNQFTIFATLDGTPNHVLYDSQPGTLDNAAAHVYLYGGTTHFTTAYTMMSGWQALQLPVKPANIASYFGGPAM